MGRPPEYVVGLVVVVGGVVASFAHHVVYFSGRSTTPFDLLANLVAPMLAGLAALSVLVSFRRTAVDDRSLLRVAAWYVGGAVVLGLAGYSSLRYRISLADTLSLFWLRVVNWAIGGSFIGLLVGHYDARRSWAVARAEANRAEADRHARRLSVLNRVLRHDMRNRLNVILAHADILAETTDSESPAVIKRHGGRLHDIAERARRLQELQDAPPQRIDLAAAVDEAVARLGDRHPAVGLSTDLLDEAEVTTYPVVTEAVDNLLENAVVHNDDDGSAVEVAVALHRVGGGDRGFVELTVADNGPGLPPLEAVVLEDGGESPLQHSRGTGLWLTRWMVEESGGELAVSESADGGTRVSIRLPAAA